MFTLNIQPGKLSLSDLRQVHQNTTQLTLDPAAIPAVEASNKSVVSVLAAGKVVYGINTGFGLLANTRIAPEELELLQKSIVLSHAAGTGKPMSDAVVRLMMVLKVNSLSRGFSGIRPILLDMLMGMVNAGVYPCVPEKGSVGASGDLAPLAHMSLPLIGEGHVRYQGCVITGAEGLKIAGFEPVTLAPKEGLALLNGTQASTALALSGLFQFYFHFVFLWHKLEARPQGVLVIV